MAFLKEDDIGKKQMEIMFHHVMLPVILLTNKLTQALLPNESRKRNKNQLLMI